MRLTIDKICDMYDDTLRGIIEVTDGCKKLEGTLPLEYQEMLSELFYEAYTHGFALGFKSAFHKTSGIGAYPSAKSTPRQKELISVLSGVMCSDSISRDEACLRIYCACNELRNQCSVLGFQAFTELSTDCQDV